MTAEVWTCQCEVANPLAVSVCEGCGTPKPALVVVESSPLATTQTTPTLCPIDGGPLLMRGAMKGFCVRFGGFPVTMACPFSCPLCRGKLDWTGGCQNCHGTTTGRRDEWAFPGDGYYTHDENGEPLTGTFANDRWSQDAGQHYVKVQGPRAACSQKTNAENAHEIARLIERIGAHTPTKEPRA